MECHSAVERVDGTSVHESRVECHGVGEQRFDDTSSSECEERAEDHSERPLGTTSGSGSRVDGPTGSGTSDGEYHSAVERVDGTSVDECRVACHCAEGRQFGGVRPSVAPSGRGCVAVAWHRRAGGGDPAARSSERGGVNCSASAARD